MILRLAIAVAIVLTSACGGPEPLETVPEEVVHPEQAPAVETTDQPGFLEPDRLLRKELPAGESHEYTFALNAGEYVELQVRQVKGDVALELGGPPDLPSPYPKIDSENRAARSEVLYLVAEASGDYELSVTAFAPGAEYEIRFDPIRAATATDRERARANRVFFEARSLRQTKPGIAAEKLREAARRWDLVGDELRQARARYELGEVLEGPPKHLEERAEAYEQARMVFERAGDLPQAALCLHRLGGIAWKMDDLEASRELFAASLARWRAIEDLHEVSIVAFDQAYMERRLGNPEAARRLYAEALDVVAHNRRPLLHKARIQTELGALHFYRGETSRGRREYRAALQILDRHPQAENERVKEQRARTLNRLGAALAAWEDATAEALEEAGSLLQEARRLREEMTDRRGVALTDNSLGLLYEKMNRPRLALRAFEQAEEMFLEQGSTADLAVVRGNRCRIVERLGKPEPARDCYLKALEGLREAGYRNAEAHCLVDLAKNARRRGELHEAQDWIRAALEVVELIRRDSQSLDLRTSLLDRKYAIYELAADLALDLHEREPGRGHADAAFHRLESVRALGLLETLVRYRPELDLPPELRDLRSEIHRVTAESLVAEADGAEDLGRLERELSRLFDRLYLERPRIAFVEPKILSVVEVRELLDPETLLLVYHLGEQRSSVWAITDSQVRWHPLPPRSVIEDLALDLYEAMSSGAHKIRTWRYDRLSRELSAMILKPVADLLARPRLAVVPAGALRYVPFAALPHPAEPAAPGLASAAPGQRELLLHSHQITYTPSASVLAALRQRGAVRTPAKNLLAMVAAPVLQEDDERLGGRADSSKNDEPSRVTEWTAPLPYAEVEAKSILELVDGEGAREAIGIDANRDFVLGGALEDVRIVHFATHGRLDETHGELSGLVLSQFDHSGRPVDGYVWAFELYDLNLRADLVVLSACETALGKAVRGEGLVGLTRAFLYAGAQRVLVSLWRVDDEATAHLMTELYRGLVLAGLPPAEALQRAQIKMWDAGWTEPYYWAPFVLQGDWSIEPAPGRIQTRGRSLRREKTRGL